MHRLLILFFALVLFSCQDAKKNDTPQEVLPNASGRPSEILFVMDTSLWRGEWGNTFKDILETPQKGLPYEESQLELSCIPPNKFQSFVQRRHTVVIPLSLDQKTSIQGVPKDSLASLFNQNTSLLFFEKENVHAAPQHILYLVAPSMEEMPKAAEVHKLILREKLMAFAMERQTQATYVQGEQEKLTEHLQEKYGFSLRIPKGFQLAKKEDSVVWLRDVHKKSDLNIFITWTDYTSQVQLNSDSVQAWRNLIAQRHLANPEAPSSYPVIDHRFSTFPKAISFGGRYALESRGYWELLERTMGGPFLSYALVDEDRGRIYYIEGFAWCPAQKKLPYIRKLESILKTLDF